MAEMRSPGKAAANAAAFLKEFGAQKKLLPLKAHASVMRIGFFNACPGSHLIDNM